jgi:hypothetical protein
MPIIKGQLSGISLKFDFKQGIKILLEIGYYAAYPE